MAVGIWWICSILNWHRTDTRGREFIIPLLRKAMFTHADLFHRATKQYLKAGYHRHP